MTDEHKSAARLLRWMTTEERERLIAELDAADRHAEERAKLHPLTADRFTAEELAGLRAHLLDGGGVADEAALKGVFLQALMDEDWATFFAELPHFLKAWMLRTGVITRHPSGIVTVHGVGRTPTPEMIEGAKTAIR